MMGGESRPVFGKVIPQKGARRAQPEGRGDSEGLETACDLAVRPLEPPCPWNNHRELPSRLGMQLESRATSPGTGKCLL